MADTRLKFYLIRKYSGHKFKHHNFGLYTPTPNGLAQVVVVRAET